MNLEKSIFNRVALLTGEETINQLKNTRIIIFGLGGVGSWCAESLVRTGIGNITLVDNDIVCATNINRQLPATTKNIGKPKIEVLKERFLEINPNAIVTTKQQVYNQETAESFCLNEFDCIIDAIDSLKDKALLIENACKTNAFFVSSMGAALKSDPQKIKTAEFWNVKGCPLARALRQKFKRLKTFPVKKFTCVYSDELLENQIVEPLEDDVNKESWSKFKAQANGTFAHITAIFGFTLAGLVVNHLVEKYRK